jgi:hypothetical protein
MQRGEIHLAAFPFGDAPGMKLRLVLLLTRRMNSLQREAPSRPEPVLS